jgi:phage terminase large subunit-like protein
MILKMRYAASLAAYLVFIPIAALSKVVFIFDAMPEKRRS